MTKIKSSIYLNITVFLSNQSFMLIIEMEQKQQNTKVKCCSFYKKRIIQFSEIKFYENYTY